MTKLLLIESPGKLKKLKQILGAGWIVKASMGHIRELTNEGEDALGFEFAGDRITCKYAPRDARAKKTIADLRKAAKQANTIYIATDPDREGETIGWHLQQALRLKQPHRVVYSEITPSAVRKAVANPRKLDASLIAAGRARDCLDKLVGYRGSRHIVWPLNNGAKSMGRVQSAALHLLCQRERVIQAFTPEDYWSVSVTYAEGFKAFYKRSPKAVQLKQSADKTTTQPNKSDQKKEPESERVSTKAEADRLVQIARTNPHQVHSIEGKTKRQSPPPPFITSSLQQVAGAKLRFTPDQTMKVAQTLYEAGHITYMRTDSVALAAPFRAAVKAYLTQNDPTNVPKTTTKHRAVKGAQAAHEAIRPTDINATPTQLKSALSPDTAKLYDLIWRRAVASQCAAARLLKTRIITQSADIYWEAKGQVIEFAGYTRYWNNLSADSVLPTLQAKQALQLSQAESEKKQTKPPPRYSEPKLIQLMERKGIGRPSTYAPTIKTLKSRSYAHLLKGKLQPTELGLALDGALETLLPDLIRPEFTAKMEADLDAIASGKQNWERYLTQWNQNYFAPAIESARAKLNSEKMNALRADSVFAAASTKTRSTDSPYSKTKVTYQTEQSSQAKSKTSKKQPSSQNRGTSSKTAAKKRNSDKTKSKTCCPNCQQPLTKIPSRSKKLKANHFLKCENLSCDVVMFWNPNKKSYELPYAKRAADPKNFTNHPCPSCGALLIRHHYQKEGTDKVMLRCSILENRKTKCKNVAFFKTREGNFWSPKFGVLENPSNQTSSKKVSKKSAPVRKR